MPPMTCVPTTNWSLIAVLDVPESFPGGSVGRALPPDMAAGPWLTGLSVWVVGFPVSGGVCEPPQARGCVSVKRPNDPSASF